jgi:hypothetical protein
MRVILVPHGAPGNSQLADRSLILPVEIASGFSLDDQAIARIDQRSTCAMAMFHQQSI